MLTGSELLAKVAEMTGASKADIARACGYVSTKKDGSERINFTAYYEAIITAKGVDLGTPAVKARSGRKGKPLSFKVKASKTGVIPVTAGYSSLIDVADGDYVTIEQVDGGLLLRKAASDEAQAPAAAACEAAPVVITEPAVITYESIPAPAERELAPF